MVIKHLNFNNNLAHNLQNDNWKSYNIISAYKINHKLNKI